jgi:hypothetical protein
MEAEQTQSFNQKLSQWIASQGFWFQLRHSMSGGGGWSVTLNHLLRLSFKLAIALVVAAGGFGLYLVKRVDSEAFLKSLDAGIAKGLSAKDAQVDDFARIQGVAHIRRMAAEGGEGSIFRDFHAGNIRFKMGLLAGMSGRWDAGTLQAKWMSIDLKAGADSPEQSALLGDALLREWPGFEFSSIEVDEASLRWGYSQQTSGRIDGSHLVATRSPGGWRLVFHGGTFSQNWLRQLQIVELVIECGRDGLKVVKGDFTGGGGTVVLENFEVKGGHKPELSGRVELSKVELGALLPEPVTHYVEGVISAELEVSGSTNTLEGVQFEGDITLDGDNFISLRERFELLRLLSVVDVYNSYRKVDFKEGGFRIKTGGGSMKLNRVDMKAAAGLMTMQGLLEVRFPTDEELGGEEGLMPASRFAPVFDPKAIEKDDGAGDEITLQKAGRAEANSKGAEMYDRLAQKRIDDVLLEEEMIRRSQALRCSGGMTITIPGDAFDRNERLREVYPIDADSGRIKLDVPLDGVLYDLTRRQADEIRKLSEDR